MRIYLDTGVFFDFLIERGHVANTIRKGRRGRSNSQLASDIGDCFQKFNSHDVFTSNITLYEVEDAMFRNLSKTYGGVPNSKKFILMSSRPVILQTMTVCSIFNIIIEDVTAPIFDTALRNIEFQKEGILIGDSIHLSTAISQDVEMIISGDDHILNLDMKIKNSSNKLIRCFDTDVAKGLL